MLLEKNHRILVIDDNQTIHEDFRKILTMPGNGTDRGLDAAEAALFGAPVPASTPTNVEIDSALQGQEGLRLVEKAVAAGRPYAMAFVDVRMPPGWDGLETTSHIWRCDPDIQIVICTAYSEYSWDRMLEKIGHTDRLLILKKPFDNIEVLQLANALAEKWQLLQESKILLNDLEKKVHERTIELEAANQKLEAEIQERKQAEAALRRSQETVVRQERLAVVGQLSAGLAHEFNNILTIIQGHASLLASNKALNWDGAQSLNEIHSSTERAARLTRQMLAFSRKQVMQRQLLDLNDLVLNAKKMLTSTLREDIELCFCTEARRRINADPGMMEQIVLNLAINARDAMPKGGKLLIGTKDVEIAPDDITRVAQGKLSGPVQSAEAYAGLFVCLTVSDTGCGMDQNTLQHLFEPFFTTKEIGKGTGLGLSTVYGLAKQHEGWVEVSSQMGQGATFKIYLPALPSLIEKEFARKGSSAAGGGKTVLVAEDEPALRALIRSVLKNQGFNVLEAGSGVEALEIWRVHSGEICLLLTDMVMPEGVSGRELAAKLTAEKPALPVIYMSGYSEEILGHDALGDGANFLPKPYHPGQLIEMMCKCLDNKSRQVG